MPEEFFSEKKPEFSHLRIFGCPVYIQIPKEKRTKLDPSGRKGIFVGYSKISKAYIIYFPRFKKINIIWDVTLMKTWLITNLERDLLKTLKKQKYP